MIYHVNDSRSLADFDNIEKSISVDFILKIFCPYNLKSLSILLETHKIKIDRQKPLPEENKYNSQRRTLGSYLSDIVDTI